MDLVLFMVFALIENLGLLTLIFALYRLNLEKHWFPALVISIIMHLVNFYIRNEYLTVYTPVIVLIFIILLLTVVVRIPVIWAVVVAVTGYLAYNLLQIVVWLVASLSHFLPSGQFQASGWRANVLQLITGVISFAVGRYLYRRGIGYAFPFERLQFRLGTIGLIIMLSIIAVASSATLYFSNFYTVMAILLIGFTFLIYWAQRKEKEDGNDIL